MQRICHGLRRAGVWFSAEKLDFFLLQSARNRSEFRLTSYSIGTGDSTLGIKGEARLHLVSRRRINGSSPLLTLTW